MPPARPPSKAVARGAAAKPQPAQPSRFARAFGRFGAAQRRATATSSRTATSRTGGIGTLLRDVRQELRKVEWPSREELTKLTAAVVGLSAVVGAFLGGVDFVFQEFFKFIISLSGGGV